MEGVIWALLILGEGCFVKESIGMLSLLELTIKQLGLTPWP